MIGVIANTVAIIIGGLVGLAAKKIIPETWNDVIVKGIGLAVIYIGVSGALVGNNALILILSIVFGAIIGEALKLDERLNSLADKMQSSFTSGNGDPTFSKAFVTATLLMCVGAMGIVGALNAGLKGDNSLLFTKTALDGVSAIMFTASMGAGVIFASVPVFLLEGGIFLLATKLAPVLTTTVINEMTCVGFVLIIALGLNMVIGTKLKVMNYVPAVFLPIAFCPLYTWIVGLF